MKIVKNLKSIVIIFSILVFMLVAYAISAEFFEPKAYNLMVSQINLHLTNKYGSDDIVVVAIDDKSVDRIRWPWRRELYSKIFEYFDKYTVAKMVGFDAIIATPDVENPASDLKFYSSIKGDKKLVVGFVPMYEPYVSKADGDKYDKMFKNKFSIDIKDERSIKQPSYYQSLSKFPKEYFNSISKVGSVLTSPDNDGYIRSLEQMVDYKGTLYPSLSLRMYAALHPGGTFIVKNNEIIYNQSKLRIPTFCRYNSVFNNIHYYKMKPIEDASDVKDKTKSTKDDTKTQVDKAKLTKDSSKSLVDDTKTQKDDNRPHFQYSHKVYSAIDIMDSLDAIKKGKTPKISPQVFENKIVFVGGAAKAIALGLKDTKMTPMSSDHPGVDIQATNLDNIMHNEFITSSTPFLDILNILIVIGITYLICRYLSLFVSIGLVALMMILYILICVLSYRFNIAINIITPIFLQIITMLMTYSYRVILEGRNREKIKHAMGRYISHDVMQNVVKDIDGLKLGGKRANVTVLFADIRGFTSMSENMSAEEVSVILNEYFTEIEPIISQYNGVINKFIGDAVLAIFGEPIQDKNHALNAVKCANDMLKKVDELQKKWIKEGKPKIEIGVGINTGEAFVGNIGSEKRLEYTVIGDVVNLASRIESYNKVYKTSFLISSTTYENVRNIADVIKISEVSIRGKAKKLDIYEVLRLVQ